MKMHLSITVAWFVLAFLSLSKVAQQFSELQFEQGGYEVLQYGNFKEFLDHKLNISQVLATFLVKDYTDCAFKCLDNIGCLSFNFATKPAIGTDQHSCHLLASDRFNHSSRLVPSDEFHHYTFWSLCENSPCQNGGSCRPLYENKSFVCDCLGSYYGPLCENLKDCKKALGMANGEISDQQITASSEYDGNHAAKQGRLFFQETPKLSGSWSVAPHELSRLSWLQVDLQNKHTKVTGVATQGRNYNNFWSGPYYQWVTSYKLDYSDNGVSFLYYKEGGKATDKVFSGNTDRETVVYQAVNPPIRARFIRFRPITWNSFISMRAELYGCKGSSWLKINTDSVCFGAKNSAFGTFEIRQSGDMYNLKLVHQSGAVNCGSNINSGTKWGCSGLNNKLNVHITNESNARIFPPISSFNFDVYLFYKLPGFHQNSAEIVFDFFPVPLSVTIGQRFRVWYGEDLIKNGEANNVGNSCIDVYGFY
ncbi:uncharacterized protein [Acropora muricata]|uniref:uncharacterized protein isoform X1 n=2 Tax=Acropora muricata TaxID=159855 RepID=UPI0034E54A63